jgi:drug/metabolite transporter (DMT)-like permease
MQRRTLAILAGFFLRERITPGQVAGLGLALLGALLVAMRTEGLEIGKGGLGWSCVALGVGVCIGCIFHRRKSCRIK